MGSGGWLGMKGPVVRLGSFQMYMKVQPTGFAEGLEVECERKIGVEDDS